MPLLALCAPPELAAAAASQQRTTAAPGIPAQDQTPSYAQAEDARDTILVRRAVMAMGTMLTIEVDAPDRDTGLRWIEDAVTAVQDAEKTLSTWRPESALSRWNRIPESRRQPLPSVAWTGLTRALLWAERTGGALDPSVGALVDAWGLRTQERRDPSEDELRAALAQTGYAHLTLDPKTRTLSTDALELKLDAGGFGKGLALDLAARAIRNAAETRALRSAAETRAIPRARLDFGGQLHWVGYGSASQDAGSGGAIPEVSVARFSVAIAHPHQPRGLALELPTIAPAAVLRLRGIPRSVATSGNGERLELAAATGAQPFHLLDPRTGRPARDFGSLTVLATQAVDADCLSTALYVLGPDLALAFAEAHDDIDIVVVECESDGSSLRVRASRGLEGALEVHSQ